VPTLTARLVGGPTAILEYGGLRWLTDPALSPPGDYDGLTKTTGPALGAQEIGPIDVVLLSHDQHADNLDPAGRAFLPRAGRVVTTVLGAQRLGGATGLQPWATAAVPRPDGAGAVSVTALPARHGPPGSEPVTGPVIGFLLEGEDLGRVYVSGDNAAVEVVEEIAQRVGPVDVAVLFAGAVSLPRRFDGAYLTLPADRAVEVARILDAGTVVPLHFEGWSHFTQGADALGDAFAAAGLSDRLALLRPGQTITI
jgi:L-ascorbate metabolism protein UlaG (beta-lactamase superfamily)